MFRGERLTKTNEVSLTVKKIKHSFLSGNLGPLGWHSYMPLKLIICLLVLCKILVSLCTVWDIERKLTVVFHDNLLCDNYKQRYKSLNLTSSVNRMVMTVLIVGFLYCYLRERKLRLQFIRATFPAHGLFSEIA